MSISPLSPATLSPIDKENGAFTPLSALLHPSSTSSSLTAATLAVPNELRDLRRRTAALQAERDHVKQLGERAADAFEVHRRDLTQLAQKERTIRGIREDGLRAQLQETLCVNRDLMARVVEQRQQREAVWRAELQSHRTTNAARQSELEGQLADLHEERAELQRSVAGAESTRDAVRREVARCLEEQAHLHAQLRLVREVVTAAAEAAASAAPFVRGENGAAGLQLRTRQPCCDCCDLPHGVWRGPSPTRRVPRRRFVPAGPSGLSRASSPTPTHHIDALLSAVERESYLRPRLYYQRRGWEQMTPWPPLSRTASPLVAVEGRRGSSAGRHMRAASPFRWVPPEGQQLHKSDHHQPRSQSPSSATASLTSSGSRGRGTDTCASSSHTSDSSLMTTSVPVSREGGARVHKVSPPSQAPPSRSRRRSSPPLRSGDTKTDPDTVPFCWQQQQRHRSSERFSSPTHHKPLHGSALNAACRSLLSDLAEARASYHRYQQQLRDPLGDSVQASQEMRRLMRYMDERIGQLRALRREQERYRDPLRVHDVLQQVMAENQYCEAVYKDLMDLIRA